MSKKDCELNAIENLYEKNVETYMELMGIDDDRDVSEHDLELMYRTAEEQFYTRGD